EPATVVKVAFKDVPTLVTAAMMATAISVAIRPYSIAVAPDSFLMKRDMNSHMDQPPWKPGRYANAAARPNSGLPLNLLTGALTRRAGLSYETAQIHSTPKRRDSLDTN